MNVSPQPQCNCADVMEPNKIGAKGIQRPIRPGGCYGDGVGGAVTIRAGWPAPHVKGPAVYCTVRGIHPWSCSPEGFRVINSKKEENSIKHIVQF